MARTINVPRDFHSLPLPVEVALDRMVNPEPVLRHFNCQPTSDQQNLFELRADLELPICDSQDVVLAMLAGQGSLLLNQEVVLLEPEIVVFIPGHTPHTLRSQTDLTFLLSRYEPDPGASESVWVINL